MYEILDESRHLSKLDLEALKADKLLKSELIRITTHTANCKNCAKALADSFNADELSGVPSGFMEKIVRRLHRNRNNRQFVFYTTRVTIAVCAALAIVFSGTLNFITNMNDRILNIKPPDLSLVSTINTSLQDFSQKLLDMEVFQNEKEKK
ncbi:MAG: hypothetical protein Q7J78_07065 [Clostridiales bacterium]|nr:hypothetical protein [Clostridiales bacterium]